MKITVENQWEHLTYRAGKRVLKAGEFHTFRFPDGRVVENFLVRSTVRHVPNGDHAPQLVRQEHLHILVVWGGVTLQVPLEMLEWVPPSWREAVADIVEGEWVETANGAWEMVTDGYGWWVREPVVACRLGGLEISLEVRGRGIADTIRLMRKMSQVKL